MMMSSGRSVDLSVSISHAPDDTVSAAAVDKLTDEYFLGKLCKHIPRMLRHQLISKLVNQYIFREKNQSHQLSTVQETASVRNTAGDAGVDFQANTSIYRFHGTLLFVDISGFTVLSQKLKVDALKNQINAYFQKIVDIINKYDGEIIKFAGDALFIIWQTKVNTTGANETSRRFCLSTSRAHTFPHVISFQRTPTFSRQPKKPQTTQSNVALRST